MTTALKNLAHRLTAIHDVKVMEAFLQDLLTPGEIEEIDLRVKLVGMLLRGVPQREIAATLGVSIAKVTRGSRELQYGHQGFARVLKN